MRSGRRAGNSVKNSNLFALAFNFGWNLLVSIAVLGFLGRWLDAKLGTDPWLLIVGILLGIAVGFKGLFVQILQDDQGKPNRQGKS